MKVLAVGVAIAADDRAVRNAASFVDDRVRDMAAASDLDLGKHDRATHLRALVDEHAEEQHRLADDGARYDAAAGDHRVDREAAAVVLVQDELRARYLLLIRPDRPRLVVE